MKVQTILNETVALALIVTDTRIYYLASSLNEWGGERVKLIT